MSTISVQSTASFEPLFGTLGTYEKENPLFQESLSILNDTLGRPVQLLNAMDVYVIHRALIRVNRVVYKQLQHLEKDWNNFLTRLNGYPLNVKNSYPVHIDTTTVQKVLAKKFSRPSISKVDLKDIQARKKLVEYLIKVDRYTFREHFPRGFVNNMLNTSEARAIAAYDSEQRIVGALWGFFTTYEGKKIFHSWSISVLPGFSDLKIARELIAVARLLQSREYSEVKIATLNVDHDNPHAKAIYIGYRFSEMPGQRANDSKTLMSLNLDETHPETEIVSLPLNEAKNACQTYVMKNAYKVQLAFWFLPRFFELIALKIFWYLRNPTRPTVDLHKFA